MIQIAFKPEHRPTVNYTALGEDGERLTGEALWEAAHDKALEMTTRHPDIKTFVLTDANGESVEYSADTGREIW